MENFDDLTNDQIRLKLLEYGLPNIPVTSTSRKVLIKKLKNHVENANTKVRRETIHVAKYSSDEDVEEQPVKKAQPKKEANRRATIGGSAAKLSQTLPVMPQLPPPSKPAAEKVVVVDVGSKRRSGRLTPVLSKDDATPVVAAPKEPMIVENSDDEDEVPLTQFRSRDRKSKSKSPSLSRAEMVTTSYLHQKAEAAAKPVILEEMEIDLTESTDEVMVEPPEEEPEPEPKPLPKPVVCPPGIPYHESRINSTTTTSKRITIGGTGPSASDALSSSFGRPSLSATTTTYTSFSSPAPKHREDIKLDPTDSPYLSEFTKRLSRLKAESQGGVTRDYPVRRTIGSSSSYGVASPKVTTGGGGSDYVQSRLAAARGQKPAAVDGKGEIRASLRQVILALDQKYSFKKLFYTLIVILIVVFLFVFFFM